MRKTGSRHEFVNESGRSVDAAAMAILSELDISSLKEEQTRALKAFSLPASGFCKNLVKHCSASWLATGQ